MTTAETVTTRHGARTASPFVTVFGASLLAACSNAITPAPDGGVRPACTFTNPVAVGADPWVIRDGATYYAVESRDNAIWVSRSTALSSYRQNTVKVWTAPDTGWNRTNVWAPELQRIDGRWYIYYTAGRTGPPFVAQRSGVLEASSADPQGAWIDRGMLYTGDDTVSRRNDVWAIDLTVGRIAGQLWAVWSGWERNAATDRTPQHLYAARMSDPVTIGGRRVRISSPVESWERGTELDLQEGPEFLENGPHRFIVYSTRESWLPAYRLGMLRIRDTLVALSDTTNLQKVGPVFGGSGRVFGAGHPSFTTSPDGSEPWIVYHSKVDSTPGWNRVIRMQRFSWKPDGAPDFGVPVASSQALALPSGECRP